MFVIPESPLTGQILTLIKPVGKEIPFRVGEIIEGLVSDIFPAGGLTIKVKGGFLPARTDLDFQKNEILFLKVLGQGSGGGELMLQFLGRKPEPDESLPGTKLPLVRHRNPGPLDQVIVQ